MAQEIVRAQKGELIKNFTRTQWDNMNKEMVNHKWVLIGATPNSNPDIPQEIIDFKKLKIEKAKEEVKVEEVKTDEVPGFEEVKVELVKELVDKDVEVLTESYEKQVKKAVVKKKSGRPAKKKNNADKK